MDLQEEAVALPVEEAVPVTVEELARLSGLSAEEIAGLVEFGVFEPIGGVAVRTYRATCLVQARSAHRLKQDFDLNLGGMVLALTYLERIEALERRLRELECRLPT